LHTFGSAKGVSRAAVEDLIKVEGVSEALAVRIHGYFRKG
jgi:excinuclease ABC subunit C